MSETTLAATHDQKFAPGRFDLEHGWYDNSGNPISNATECQIGISMLNAITKNVIDAVITADAHGIVETFNPAAEKLFGYSAREITGRSLSTLLPIVDREAFDNYLVNCLSSGGKNSFGPPRELNSRRNDGTVFPIELSLEEVQQSGRMMVVMIARDLTQRKHDDERLRSRVHGLETQHEAQLRVLHNELETTRRQAETASRFKREFLDNINHEIRTPMTAILGYTDLLLEESWGRASLNWLHVVRRNGKHLLRVIDDIIDISRIESGGIQIESVRCSPWQLVHEIAMQQQSLADEKQINLSMESVGQIPESIDTDPIRLRQILSNLIGNAIKFTQRGSVRIILRMESAFEAVQPILRFDVVDTGIGMTPEQQVRLFEAFAQADSSSTRKFGGTGLGLTISQRLSTMLGGNLSVQSCAGRGSTFSLTIVTGSLAGTPRSAGSQILVVQNPLSDGARKAFVRPLDARILLAEDGLDNQRLISCLLKKAGAAVCIAENGKVAFDKMMEAIGTENAFDMIFMDMQMPEMDGYETTRRLRNAGCRTPIIALTAHASDGDREKCLATGCDDYLSKPVNRHVLISRAAKWVTISRFAGNAEFDE